MVDKVLSVAKKFGADEAIIFPSPTEDNKKNPLPFKQKVAFMKKVFKKVQISNDPSIKTPFFAAKKLSDEGFTDVIMVVGQDRVADFRKTMKAQMNRNDNKRLKFKNFKVVSAGARDPDAKGVEGMSASKLRDLVVKGKFKAFSKGLPTGANTNLARKLYLIIRKKFGLKENTIDIREVAPPDAALKRFVEKPSVKKDFKKRYGDEWKSVLFATAWAMFNRKKEAGTVVESLDATYKTRIKKIGGGNFVFDFTTEKDTKLTVKLSLKTKNRYELSLFPSSKKKEDKLGFNVDQTSNPTKVLNTVAQVVVDFVKEIEPKEIRFDVPDKKKLNVFAKVINRKASDIPGYKFSITPKGGELVNPNINVLEGTLGFKHYITELFDNPFKWKKLPQGGSRDVLYSFVTDGGEKIVVDFGRVVADDLMYHLTFDNAATNIDFAFAPTGKGESARVFATILDIGKDFFKKVKPDVVVFTGEKSSRNKLYTRMMKTIKLPGYTNRSVQGGGGFVYKNWFIVLKTTLWKAEKDTIEDEIIDAIF